MAENRNAFVRYYYIDEMLKSKTHRYTMQEICDKCNSELLRMDFPEATKRTYQTDILDIQSPPFNAEIETTKDGRYIRYHYADPTFSIFKPVLSQDEKNLLAVILNNFGHFDGLAGFEGLDDLSKSLKIRDNSRKIIVFDHNDDYDCTLLPKLFSAISNKKTLKLTYKSFSAEKPCTWTVYPYLLKQHNNRWFLIAKGTDGLIRTYAIDRIVDADTTEEPYRECAEDFDERYDDIVGVTINENAMRTKIIIWADDNTYRYIETKPINGSQKLVSGEKENELRILYPEFVGGKFFSYDMIINIELKNLLMSYIGAIVIEPSELRDKMRQRVEWLKSCYSL